MNITNEFKRAMALTAGTHNLQRDKVVPFDMEAKGLKKFSYEGGTIWALLQT